MRLNKTDNSFEVKPHMGVLAECALTAAMLIIGTIVSLLLHDIETQSGGTMTTLLFIVCILITSVAAAHPLVCSGVECVYGILLSNFLYIEPYLSFEIASGESWMRLIVMFLISGTCGTMMARIRSQQLAAAYKAHRMEILLDMSQSLQQSVDEVEILCSAAEHIIRLVRRDVIFVPSHATAAFPPSMFSSVNDTGEIACRIFAEHADTDGERQEETFTSRQALEILSGVKTASMDMWLYEGALCVTLGNVDKDLGVIVIRPNGKAIGLDSFDKELLTAMAEQCALALEKQRSEKLKQQIQLQAGRERLRSDLLRSISHDLRTPLTGIVGNTCVLLDDEISLNEQRRHKMYHDIREDALWLLQTVENLLSITRIENHSMDIKKDLEVLADVLDEAFNRCRRYDPNHKIILEHSNEMILVKMDPHLIMQVINNLVDNAIKYTPKDTSIVISYEMRGSMVCVRVADNGDGIQDKDKQLLFETFVTLNRKVSDSKRSVGLGLSLCRTIVQAHGGSIWVEDSTPHGAIFCFTLPVDEVL